MRGPKEQRISDFLEGSRAEHRRCHAWCMLEDWKHHWLPIGVVANWESRIRDRTPQHHAAIGTWGSQCDKCPELKPLLPCLQSWWRPLGLADILDTAQSRVIAPAIAPDIQSAPSHTVVLFTWICSCYACKPSLVACNDAHGTIRGLHLPTAPDFLTAFSHLNTNRCPRNEPNSSYDLSPRDSMPIVQSILPSL